MNDKSPRRQAEDFLKSTSKELLVLAALVTEAIGVARTAIEHGVVLRRDDLGGHAHTTRSLRPEGQRKRQHRGGHYICSIFHTSCKWVSELPSTNLGTFSGKICSFLEKCSFAAKSSAPECRKSALIAPLSAPPPTIFPSPEHVFSRRRERNSAKKRALYIWNALAERAAASAAASRRE